MDLNFISIVTDVTNLNFPLRQIYVGRGSFVNMRLPLIDTERFTAAVCIEQLVEGAEPFRFEFTVNETNGKFEKRIPGWAFVNAGNTSYQILVYDTENSNAVCWCGRGKLVVKEVLSGAVIPEVPTATPPSFYVEHPVTHLWHKVVGALNDDGQLTWTTEDEGVEHV